MTSPELVVLETDPVVRHPLAEFLRECGYRVFEAGSGAEARQLLENRPDVECLLLDVGELGAEGFELSQWARQSCPGLDVILAGSLESTARKASTLCERGPDIPKPYDHQALLGLIRRLAEARQRSRQLPTAP